jgi:lysophospholipase L1-like esterase
VFNNGAATVGSTFLSATVDVTASYFRADNLTFINDYNETHPDQPQTQALALSVTGDRAVFRDMRFISHQDTVYASSPKCSPPSGNPACRVARQYFSNCYIEGNVDFIFGTGKTVFEHCEIRSNAHQAGYITAQGKNWPGQDSGFVFSDCRLTADPGVNNVWLGRPWRPYATVVFLNSEIGSHIEPAGWREWHPGETHSLETAFYAEYGSSGPGATMDKRDPHLHRLTPAEAAQFETRRFLSGEDDWDPTKPPITLFIAGDSTAAIKKVDRRPETGWAEFLQQYFDSDQVRVDDRAKNGRSTRTFISEGLWDGIVKDLRPGDYVLIEFGHNDESKQKVDRYTPLEDFRGNLMRFVNDVRAKHANAVLLTPVVRRMFDPDARLIDTHGMYPGVVRAVAAEINVPLIDMQKLSGAVVEKYGPEPSRELFLQVKKGENPNYPNGVEDNTHFSPLGAALMAAQAVNGIREDKLELTRYLKQNASANP